MSQFEVEWTDAGIYARCAPNPDYPKGIDLDFARGAMVACTVSLPYPAKRVGAYGVECKTCGARVAATTAGRPDDPRSIKIPCRQVRAR